MCVQIDYIMKLQTEKHYSHTEKDELNTPPINITTTHIKSSESTKHWWETFQEAILSSGQLHDTLECRQVAWIEMAQMLGFVRVDCSLELFSLLSCHPEDIRAESGQCSNIESITPVRLTLLQLIQQHYLIIFLHWNKIKVTTSIPYVLKALTWKNKCLF